MGVEPWEKYPNIWKTRSAFFTWLRGAIRQVWSRYPAKLAWKQAQLTKTPPEGYKGRGKSFGVCYYCGCSFTASALEVDHVQEAGSCNSWDDAKNFLTKLLDCNDNWVLACKPCHKIKSYAERSGKSFEDARLEKQVIAILKDKQKTLAILKEAGYTANQVSNASKRREALVAVLTHNGNRER